MDHWAYFQVPQRRQIHDYMEETDIPSRVGRRFENIMHLKRLTNAAIRMHKCAGQTWDDMPVTLPGMNMVSRNGRPAR